MQRPSIYLKKYLTLYYFSGFLIMPQTLTLFVSDLSLVIRCYTIDRRMYVPEHYQLWQGLS